MSTKFLSEREVRWAYEKWCMGYTQREIADALFVNTRTVGRALKGRIKIKPVLKYEFED